MASYRVRNVSPLRSLESSVKSDNAKLREKLANRRSILNQSDGQIRRLSEGRYPSAQRDHSAPRPRVSEERMDSNSNRAISRIRERKEAAEMKLKGLYTKSLSMTMSEDSSAIESSRSSVISSISSGTIKSSLRTYNDERMSNQISSDGKSSPSRDEMSSSPLSKKFERRSLGNVSKNDGDLTTKGASISNVSGNKIGVSYQMQTFIVDSWKSYGSTFTFLYLYPIVSSQRHLIFFVYVFSSIFFT